MVRGNQQVSLHEVWKKQQIREDARKMHGTKKLTEFFGKWGKLQSEGHDLVRRMDKQGEVLIWCGKCFVSMRGKEWDRNY